MASRETPSWPALVPCIVALTLFLTGPTAFCISSGASMLGPLVELGRIDGMMALISGVGIALVALGAALALAQSLQRIARRPSLGVVSALWAVSLALALVGLFAPGEGYGLCFVSAGMAYGGGSVFFLLWWRWRLGCLTAAEQLIVLGIAFAGAALIPVACFTFSQTPLMIAMNGLSVIGSWAVTVGVKQLERRQDNPDDQVGNPASGATPSEVADRQGLLPAAGGLCVCAVVLGFSCGGLMEDSTFTFAGELTRGAFLGVMVCAVSLTVAALLSTQAEKLHTVLIGLCPVLAALPSLPCIIPLAPDLVIGTLFGLMTGGGFAFFAILTSWLLCPKGRIAPAAAAPSSPASPADGADSVSSQPQRLASRFFQPEGLCGAVLLANALCFGAAALTSAALSHEAKTAVSLGLFIAYLVLFALIAFRSGGKATTGAVLSVPQSDAPNTTAAPTPPDDAAADAASADPLTARCLQLQERGNLSPREMDVLTLLARGRTAAYIADTFFLSRETVKVHIRHIYEKLGVHSRGELLDLVETTHEDAAS